MEDRRKHPRIPVEQLMSARLRTDGKESTGRVIDLNNAGAFVTTDLQLEPNTRIEVELALPGVDKSLPLKAVVARRCGPVEGKTRLIPAGVGLVFLAENVMERAFIQRAVLAALRRSLESTRARVSGGASA